MLFFIHITNFAGAGKQAVGPDLFKAASKVIHCSEDGFDRHQLQLVVLCQPAERHTYYFDAS